MLATETVQEFLDQLVHRARGRDRSPPWHHIGPSDTSRRAYAAASSYELSFQLNKLQYADGGGPCLEAPRTSVPVTVTDMTTETRWPAYIGLAVTTGAHSRVFYPLISDDYSIGARAAA